MATRIMGLASGMDIDTMVKDLMKAERVPLNKMKQEQTLLEWKRDDFREINTKIFSFRDLLVQMRLPSFYRMKYVTSTNDALVSATAAGSAIMGSYTIEVQQLATAATKVSTNGLSRDRNNKIDVNASLLDTIEHFSGYVAGETTVFHSGKVHSQSIVVENEGTTFNLNLEEGTEILPTENVTVKVGNKLYEVVDFSGDTEPNLEQLGKNQVYFNRETGELIFKEKITKDSVIEVNYVTATEDDSQYFSFSISTFNQNGEKQTHHFFFDSQATLNDVMKEVNRSPIGVTMFYDAHTDKISITTKETGNLNPVTAGEGQEGDEIILEGTFINEILQFNGARQIGGENAKVIINGLETERTSNTFEMNGVTFNLKGITDQPIYLEVNHDSEKLFENIKSFVEKYNELVELIEGKLQEPRYRDYLPLTDEEREALTDKQQEQWEEKARSGLLRNDPILSRVLTNLRMAISSPVDQGQLNPLMKSLSAIGIKTTTDYKSAKLEIDENKLREMIEKDPESIELLFLGEGENKNQLGITHRIRNIIEDARNEITEHAGSASRQNHQFTLGRQLMRIENDIERFENRLKMIEERYYTQFRRMELAIQRANEQSSMLLSFFNPFQS